MANTGAHSKPDVSDSEREGREMTELGYLYLYAWFINSLICRCAFCVVEIAINCILQAENFKCYYIYSQWLDRYEKC